MSVGAATVSGVRRYRHSNPVSWAATLLREKRHYDDWGSWYLNVRNRLVMLLRGSRPGPKPIRTVHIRGHARPFHVRMGSSDFFMLDEVVLGREYEAVLAVDLGRVERIVDLGSNAGMSIRLWQRRWPQAEIVGVEPDPNNFEVCRRNAAEGVESGRIRLVQACVAAWARPVALEHRVNEAMYRMRDAASSEAVVDALPVPELLRKANLTGPIDLLKVDIEGAERELFGNCAEWIGNVRNMVVETDLPYTAEDLLADITRCGGAFRLRSVVRNPSNNVAVLSAV